MAAARSCTQVAWAWQGPMGWLRAWAAPRPYRPLPCQLQVRLPAHQPWVTSSAVQAPWHMHQRWQACPISHTLHLQQQVLVQVVAQAGSTHPSAALLPPPFRLQRGLGMAQGTLAGPQARAAPSAAGPRPFRSCKMQGRAQVQGACVGAVVVTVVAVGVAQDQQLCLSQASFRQRMSSHPCCFWEGRELTPHSSGL